MILESKSRLCERVNIQEQQTLQITSKKKKKPISIPLNPSYIYNTNYHYHLHFTKPHRNNAHHNTSVLYNYIYYKVFFFPLLFLFLVISKDFLQFNSNNNWRHNQKENSEFTSRMLLQTVAATAFAAWRFSPAIIVKLVIIGFELKVSSASAVLY